MILKLIEINLDIDINNDELLIIIWEQNKKKNLTGNAQQRGAQDNMGTPKFLFYLFFVMGIFDQVLDGPKSRYVVQCYLLLWGGYLGSKSRILSEGYRIKWLILGTC
jgi:hypothetical protein